MTQKIFSFMNMLILSSLILIFEHIDKFSFFGFLYPWIGVILISFVILFSITMPYFFKKPKGLSIILIGILFLLFQFINATGENFKSTLVFISFLIITIIVVKNSDKKKLKVFIKLIIYCCLVNLIYGIFTLIYGIETSSTTRVGGLDHSPVSFGYNMLLGFWLILISPIDEPPIKFNKINLNKFVAFMFFIGILLSQSRGALLGLIMGAVFILLYKRKISKKLLFSFGFIIFLIVVSAFFFPSLYWDVFGFYRLFGTFYSLGSDSRLDLWYGMLKAYIEQFTILKLLFGGGQGEGADLIGRGVHSEYLKLFFDHGIIGFCIYFFNLISLFKLKNQFNIYVVGFVGSALGSGITYVNFGSITNSFSFILVFIVFCNYSYAPSRK